MKSLFLGDENSGSLCIPDDDPNIRVYMYLFFILRFQRAPRLPEVIRLDDSFITCILIFNKKSSTHNNNNNNNTKRKKKKSTDKTTKYIIVKL